MPVSGGQELPDPPAQQKSPGRGVPRAALIGLPGSGASASFRRVGLVVVHQWTQAGVGLSAKGA
ncbi:hypothetical protein I6A62_24910 [Frankia sp. AgW1.1]|nr:hypothetical protein [Frankia sp. AgW1.1]